MKTPEKKEKESSISFFGVIKNVFIRKNKFIFFSTLKKQRSINIKNPKIRHISDQLSNQNKLKYAKEIKCQNLKI